MNQQESPAILGERSNFRYKSPALPIVGGGSMETRKFASVQPCNGINKATTEISGYTACYSTFYSTISKAAMPTSRIT